MNIKHSLGFAFADPQAKKKLFWGGVCVALFFTIYFFIVQIGYLMRILSSALEGRDARLPEWTNRKDLFNEGLLPLLAILAFFTPMVAVIVLERVLLSCFTLTLGVIDVFFALKLTVMILTSIALPLGLIRLVIHGSLSEAWNIAQIADFIRRNTRSYFAAWATSAGISILGAIVGLTILGVGIFFTSFFCSVFSMDLFAQTYRTVKPFRDDKDGALRAVWTLPPPLAGAKDRKHV